MKSNPSGIVVYAGLDAEGLVARARTAFARTRKTVPQRFAAFLPLFPAELVVDMDLPGRLPGRDARIAPDGFSVDPAEYHRKLYERLPALYAGDNHLRNFTYEGRYLGRGAFTVDEVWAEMFPQYRPFLGERLAVYRIGGGGQAAAVPESVYPRGGYMLPALETSMGITQPGEEYVRYARKRVAKGNAYDADAFAAAFLTETDRKPFALPQEAIARALQEMAVVRSLNGGAENSDGYTRNARLAAAVNQYLPMRYACDCFRAETEENRVTRLMQPGYQEDDFIGDLWMPYRAFADAVDRKRGTLDVRALCESNQIAPRYDPETGGGRYPDIVYVAELRDRTLPLLTAETINNPAYGEGIDGQGNSGAVVCLPHSREKIRQGKVAVERAAVTLENRTVSPDEYRRMLALAALQEHKGRLVDALYRRETALRHAQAGAAGQEKAEKLLTARVERLSKIVEAEAEAERCGPVRVSGYDEDIEYLRRMAGERAGVPFKRDETREESIEAGYAMRAGAARLKYADAAKNNDEPNE